jgi:hypothetical protein
LYTITCATPYDRAVVTGAKPRLFEGILKGCLFYHGGSGLSDKALHQARREDAIERFMLFTGRGRTVHYAMLALRVPE